jgi:hypothetical protein
MSGKLGCKHPFTGTHRVLARRNWNYFWYQYLRTKLLNVVQSSSRRPSLLYALLMNNIWIIVELCIGKVAFGKSFYGSWYFMTIKNYHTFSVGKSTLQVLFTYIPFYHGHLPERQIHGHAASWFSPRTSKFWEVGWEQTRTNMSA